MVHGDGLLAAVTAEVDRLHSTLLEEVVKVEFDSTPPAEAHTSRRLVPFSVP
jgi:hypothetical protein